MLGSQARDERQASRALKAGLVAFFALMAYAFWRMHNAPVEGFELSIYHGTPMPVWVFLVCGYVFGIGIMVHQALSNGKGNLWVLGFGLLMLVNFISITLPLYRGYYLWGPGDSIAHLGMARDILTTGHFGPTNAYPLAHILMAELAGIGHISLVGVLKLLPPITSILYMIYAYLLASLVFKERGQVLIAAAATATLLFNVFQSTVYPHGMAQLQWPLILFLYFKARSDPSLKFKVPLVAFLVSFVFLHPTTGFMLPIFLVAMESAFALGRLVQGRRQVSGYGAIAKSYFGGISLTALAMSSVVWFMWSSRFNEFAQTIVLVQRSILGLGGVNYQLTRAENYIQLNGMDLVQYYLRTGGHVLIYGILGLIAGVLVLRGLRKGERGLGLLGAMILWGLIGDIVFVLLFFVAKQIGVISRVILLDNFIWQTPVFVGFALFSLLRRRSPRLIWLRAAAGTAVITLAALLALFGLHRSTWVYQVSNQMLYTDVTSTKWLTANQKPMVLYDGLGVSHTIPYLYLGYVKDLGDPDVSESQTNLISHWEEDVPSHFGYDNYASFGDIRAFERYLIVAHERFMKANQDPTLQRGRVLVPETGRWDFVPADFDRLVADRSVSRIYANNGTDIYFVYHGLSSLTPAYKRPSEYPSSPGAE